MTTYDQVFFETIATGSSSSAQRIVPYLVALLRPKSVVDVGCGVGTWAEEFRRQGVADVVGVDGEYVNREQLRIPSETFICRNLESPLELGRTFDLAVSLEVAEHLSPARARSFVSDLTHLAPFVVFSAAIPLQGGNHHLNEQWATYWNDLFISNGFCAVDCVRARFWEDRGVEWWYRQNLFLYVAVERMSQFTAPIREMPLDVVHPELFVSRIATPTLRFLMRSFPGAAWRSLGSRIRRLRSVAAPSPVIDA